jgi:hypothetical protein
MVGNLVKSLVSCVIIGLLYPASLLHTSHHRWLASWSLICLVQLQSVLAIEADHHVGYTSHVLSAGVETARLRHLGAMFVVCAVVECNRGD